MYTSNNFRELEDVSSDWSYLGPHWDNDIVCDLSCVKREISNLILKNTWTKWIWIEMRMSEESRCTHLLFGRRVSGDEGKLHESTSWSDWTNDVWDTFRRQRKWWQTDWDTWGDARQTDGEDGLTDRFWITQDEVISRVGMWSSSDMSQNRCRELRRASRKEKVTLLQRSKWSQVSSTWLMRIGSIVKYRQRAYRALYIRLGVEVTLVHRILTEGGRIQEK